MARIEETTTPVSAMKQSTQAHTPGSPSCNSSCNSSNPSSTTVSRCISCRKKIKQSVPRQAPQFHIRNAPLPRETQHHQPMIAMHPPFPPLIHHPYHPPPINIPRLHPHAPAPVLHNLGHGPTPLFGWESVIPLQHGYGQPKYFKRVKPDYRGFCFSVGKTDVPYAALPGGPLWGFNTTMSPQLVGRW